MEYAILMIVGIVVCILAVYLYNELTNIQKRVAKVSKVLGLADDTEDSKHDKSAKERGKRGEIVERDPRGIPEHLSREELMEMQRQYNMAMMAQSRARMPQQNNQMRGGTREQKSISEQKTQSPAQKTPIADNQTRGSLEDLILREKDNKDEKYATNDANNDDESIDDYDAKSDDIENFDDDKSQQSEDNEHHENEHEENHHHDDNEHEDHHHDDHDEHDDHAEHSEQEEHEESGEEESGEESDNQELAEQEDADAPLQNINTYTIAKLTEKANALHIPVIYTDSTGRSKKYNKAELYKKIKAKLKS